MITVLKIMTYLKFEAYIVLLTTYININVLVVRFLEFKSGVLNVNSSEYPNFFIHP